MENRNKNLLSLIITIILLSLDQLSKYFIEINIKYLDPGIRVFNGFNIVYVENKGVSFGFLSEYNIPFFLGILSFLISFYIYFLIRKSSDKVEIFGLSLILGGALGNGIDRFFKGYVIDFIDLYYKEYHWFAFNLADSFITVGAIIFFSRILKN